MCIKVYKGIYRGAFALTISYLEATEVTKNTCEELRDILTVYLNDNAINVDFSTAPHRSIITKIIRAGEDVYFRNVSMDEALAKLSNGLNIPL